MALEASSLQVIVSGTGIEATTKQLNDLAVAGERAEKSTTKLAQSSKESSKAQTDAAQEAASKYNAIVDMMTEKSTQFYADKASKAAIAAQKELFDGMAMMDKLSAASQAFYEKEAADRARQTADVLAQQQRQMDAAVSRYAAEQELANRMNAAYNTRQSASLEDAHSAAIIEDKKRAWQALGQVQSEAIRINRELDAAQKALENDHSAAILEDKRRGWKALGQAQMEAASINAKIDADAKALKADGEAFTAMLKRQAETVGMSTKELREYNMEQLRTKAAQLGVSQQVEQHIQTLQKAKGPHESFNLLTAGSARELMVLGHELSQGSFQRFGGSLIVLAERINFLPSLLEKAGVFAAGLGVSLGVLIAAIAAVVAITAAAVITYNKSSTALKEMRNEVILTGGSIGATGDQLYEMANKIGEATGKFGMSREAVIKLAATGKFTADQIGEITTAAVNLEKYGGVAIDTTIKQFEKLAAEPIKGTLRGFSGVSDAAMSLNKQLHFLEPQVLAEIIHLERIGDVAGASKIAIDNLAEVEQKRANDLKKNLTALGSFFDTVGEKASRAWNAIFHKESDGDKLANLKTQLSAYDVQGAGVYDPNKVKLQQDIATLEKKIAEDGKKAAADMAASKKRDAADLALQDVRNWVDRSKNSDTEYNALKRLERDYQALKESGVKTELTSAENVAAAIAEIHRKYAQKEHKPKSEGMSGLDAEIATITERYEIQKRAYDNEIKIIDFKKQYGLMAESEAERQKNSILDKELSNNKDRLQQEIDAIDAFHTKDVRLANEAAKKRVDIMKQLQKTKDDIETKRTINSLLPDAREEKAQQEANAASASALEQIGRQSQALQAKIDGYNKLPEAIRAAGMSEKQMQDAFTQASVDSIQEQIDSLAQLGKPADEEIARLKARKSALEDLIKKQKEWEAIQSGNTAALNTPAAIKASAAEQVKLWKDAGNEIQKALTQAFGEAGKAAGVMFKSFSEGQANQIDLSEKIAEAKLRESRTGIDETKTITALQDQQEQNQLGMYGNMANAASEFFDHQSKGYRVMQAVSQAYHLAEMAMALASIPVKLAAGAATMFAQSGWGGFAGVAAMAAVVAGFGVAIGGGSRSNVAADRQAAQGTGTVLGNDKAKSDSINKSISILEKNSGLGLAQNDTMLGYMKNVSDNISGFASLVVRATGINGKVADSTSSPLGGKLGMGAGAIGGGLLGYALGTVATMGTIGSLAMGIGTAILPVVGTAVGALVGFIASKLGGSKTSINDQGISAGAMSLGDIQASGLKAQSFTDVHSSSFWGLSQSNNTTSTDLPKNVTDQFSLVIKSLADSVGAAARALGVGGDEFTKKLQTFVVDIGTISTKGLTGDEAQKQIEAVFSKVGDDMAKFGLSGFDKFQKVGEGYLETISRVANDFLQVKDVFAVLGKSLTATGVDAANTAETLISAAGGLDNLTKGTKTFISGFLTNAEQTAPIAKSVNDKLAEMHLSFITTREQFAQVVQGLDLTTEAGQKDYAALINLADAFAKTHAAINDTTLTVQQVADQRKSLQEELESLTLTNVELLKKQRDAIDGSNLALYDQVQAIKAMKDNAATSLGDVDTAFTALQGAVTRQKNVLKTAFDTQMKQIEDKISLETKSNEKLKTLASNLQSALDSMKPTIQSAEVSKALRAQAQQQLQDAVKLFKSGGIPDAEALKNPLSVATSDATDMFSSAVDYQRDFQRTQNTIADLSKYSNSALSTSDKILQTLNEQKDAAQTAYDAQIKNLDDIVDHAQEQINILKGQSTTLLSIDQGIKALEQAMLVARQNPLVSGNAAIGDAYQTSLGRAPDAAGSAFWNTQISKGVPISDILSAINNSPEAKVKALYQSVLGRTADASGLDFWMKQMNNGVSSSAIEQAMKSSDEFKNIPHFSKGINEIPEDMLAMVHKGERILPQADNLELMQRLKSPQANAEALGTEVTNLRQEIASLKETIRSGDVANVQQTKEVVKLLKRWDVDGQPETRNVEA